MKSYKIPFVALGRSKPLEFCVRLEQVCLEGSLSLSQKFSAESLVEIRGRLSGIISVVCDLSGEEFEKPISEEVSLLLSDGLYTPRQVDGGFLDVIECKNGIIDLEEILLSEVELIKSDYHTKPDLNKKELKWQFQSEE